MKNQFRPSITSWIIILWIIGISVFPAVAQTITTDALVVEYTIMNAGVEGVLVRGTMTVKLLNRTSGVIDNVNLRLAIEGMNWIEKGVYQFGRIPAGESQIIAGEFLFDQQFYNSGRAVTWWVEYDDIGMNNFQGLIVGSRI